MRRRAVLLLNPAAGSSRRLLTMGDRPSAALERVISTLAAAGVDVELVLTRAPGHAAELARDAAAREGIDVVFALGGDGMLRETAIGLLGGNLPLAPLPAGTVNVLARVLEIPRDPLRAAALLADSSASQLVHIDVGVVLPAGTPAADPAPVARADPEHTGAPVPVPDRAPIPFLMMASRGLDARALERLPPAWKRRFGRAGVALSGLRELARGVDPPFPYALDGAEVRTAAFLSASNIPLYGGHFVLAAGALADDQLLDVVVHERIGRVALLGFAVQVALGRATRAVRAREVELPGSGAATLQVDGDAVVIALPARITLAAQTLPVLVPRPSAAS